MKKTLEKLIPLIMKSLFGDTLGKDVNSKHGIKTERWMWTKIDVGVIENYKLAIGGFIIQSKNDEAVEDDESSKSKRRPSHLGVSILSNSKKVRSLQIQIKGIDTIGTFYKETDSSFFEKTLEKVNEVGFYGEELGQRKNGFRNGWVYNVLFLAPTVKFCLTIIEFGAVGA